MKIKESLGGTLFYKDRVLYVCIFALLLLSYGISTMIFRFRDGVSLTVWSVEFWDVVFNDKLLNFYEYTQMNLRGASHGTMAGSWLTMLPWIIWNFPIWLTHRDPLTTDITGGFCCAWSKLLLVICVFVLCLFVFKIVMLCTENHVESALFATLLTAGSLEIFDSTTFAGQDEIIYVLWFIIALYEMLKGKNIGSLACQTLCVTFCPLMIIPAIIMNAYYEKRIYRLILKAVITLLPSFLFSMAYAGDPVYQSVKGVNSVEIFQNMINTGTISMTLGNTSIPVILLIFIAFAAYVHQEKENKKDIVFYLCLTVFALIFMMYSLFYRYLIYVPFFAIYAAISENNRPLKTLLLLGASASRFIYAFSYPDRYGAVFLVGFMQRFVTNTENFWTSSLMQDNILCIVRPISVACALLVLYVSHNKKTYPIEMPDKLCFSLYLASCPIFVAFLLFWFLR